MFFSICILSSKETNILEKHYIELVNAKYLLSFLIACYNLNSICLAWICDDPGKTTTFYLSSIQLPSYIAFKKVSFWHDSRSSEWSSKIPLGELRLTADQERQKFTWIYYLHSFVSSPLYTIRVKTEFMVRLASLSKLFVIYKRMDCGIIKKSFFKDIKYNFYPELKKYF